MRTKLLAATALAGSLAMASVIWGSAQATPAPLLHAPSNGTVTLVGHEGGGGGGGGGRGGGGGGPGGGAMIHGGGGGQPGAVARRDFGGHGRMSGRDYAGPRTGGPRFAEGGDRGHIERGDRGRFVERHDRGDRFEHRRFSERDHDFDRFHNRHRVFRNGVWVWVYGPDYYSYNDCWWLRERALYTGNPYWWSRYNYCVGYY
jgi:hypothetical protein